MKKELLQTVKGMRDFNFDDMVLRERMISVITANFRSFGYLPIETPTLEKYDLLMDKYGEEADKLIYNFTDRGGRRLGMIYDLTVPLSRYVAQNYNSIKFPFKRYQIQRVYRCENTQRGRFREFYQCDIDYLGSDSADIEGEILSATAKILRELGLGEFEAEINFRDRLNAFLSEKGIPDGQSALFLRAIDKLDKTSEEDVCRYLKENGFQSDAGKLIRALKEEYEPPAVFSEIRNYYKALGGSSEELKFNPLLARGLSYYTGPVFEFKLKGADMGTVAGGGRYDGLVEALIDKKVPACGIALGFERLFEILKTVGGTSDNIEYFIANLGNRAIELELLRMLTEKKRRVFYYPDRSVKLGAQLRYASEMKTVYALLVGDEEASSDSVAVKDLKKKEQKVKTLKVFREELK